MHTTSAGGVAHFLSWCVMHTEKSVHIATSLEHSIWCAAHTLFITCIQSGGYRGGLKSPTLGGTCRFSEHDCLYYTLN